nr:PKD domain-containing protein [Pedobacter panaciterrae]
MKKLFAPLVLLFCLGIVISCSKTDAVVEPDPAIINAEANFEITPGDDPFTFDFKNLSTKFKRLEWRFGDDTLSTVENPSHVYLTTGTYTVDLRAYSETGAVSRKVLELKILPEKIIVVSGVKGAAANSYKFDIRTEAQIKTANWKVVDASKPTSTTQTSTALSPEFLMPVGSVAQVTLNVVTEKGSTAELVLNGSTAGILENITNIAVFSVSKDNDGGKNANEGSLKLIDKDVGTKMFQGWDNTNGFKATFQYQDKQTVKFYGIGSANDSQDRDPKNWVLEGSNDGSSWETVDARALTRNYWDQRIDLGWTQDKYPNNDFRYKQMFYYEVATPKSFLYFRLNISTNFGSGGFQISEIRLFR